MVVLDSDILVGILRENKDAIDFADALEKRGEELNTTVINIAELVEGAFLLADSDKFNKVENLTTSFNSYNLDNAAAWKTGEISAALKKKGQKLDFPDIAIAAISISNDETLITRNIKHFSRIKGLKIEKW